jgi:hypothetical protein
MTQLGIGPGFLAWTDQFLAPSPTRAMVNGFIPPVGSFRGRVRQGCPLSPALYIFIVQAFSCWLKANLPGIMIAQKRYVSVQFADDTVNLWALQVHSSYIAKCYKERPLGRMP